MTNVSLLVELCATLCSQTVI